MSTTISGTSGVTFPAGGVGNPAGTVVGTTDSQTLTNKTLTSPTLSAGTTALPSMLLTSGTNLTSATAGAIEYDGKVVYGTPIGTQRGIVPTQQYYRLDSNLAGSNGTSAQSLFGVGVTLSASTVYEIETVFILSKSAGATSHNISLSFAGTATLNNIVYVAFVNQSGSQSFVNGSNSSAYTFTNNSASANTLTIAAITSATSSMYVVLKSTVSINAGGTFIPQYTLSAAPGGAYSTYAGSYIRINPLSASGAATNVGTWA